mmetsp:Transcript_162566/g.521162  ORF Transcript_162566/g.521162 Transcript_162566/m.521162 type:complete len:519 (-) Transcript_162566:258-1814(-)
MSGFAARSLLDRHEGLLGLAHGALVACRPGSDILERVEGSGVAVHAVVGAEAEVVADDGGVVHTGHTQVVHAIGHILVLTPVVGVVALVAAEPPSLDGVVGEGLNGTVHHVADGAIHDVHVLADVGVQMRADPIGEHDGIRINLQRVGVVPPNVEADDGLPGVDEEQGVASGVVDGPDDGRTGELDGLVIPDPGSVIGSQDRKVVATEDASAHVILRLEKAGLVASRADDSEAVERWKSFGGDAIALRAHGLATPSSVGVVRMHAGLARVHALCPSRIFLHALDIHPDAALVVEAPLVQARACRRCPGRHLAALGSIVARSPLSHSFARPTVVLAGGLARAEVVVLLVANLTRILAATDLGAVRPAVDTLACDPRHGACLRLAELVARPRIRIDVIQVGSAWHALGLASCPRCILLEASMAGLAAALRLPAVHAWISAGVLARRPGSCLLARPVSAIPVRRVFAGHTARAALRVEAGSLLVALMAGGGAASAYVAILQADGAGGGSEVHESTNLAARR